MAPPRRLIQPAGLGAPIVAGRPEDLAVPPPSHVTGDVPSFDGLRAIAVLAVIVFHVQEHFTEVPVLHYVILRSWFGLDLFFTLSGSLITWLLLREVAVRGRASLGQPRRRACRSR